MSQANAQRRAAIAAAKTAIHRCQLQPGIVVSVRVVRVAGEFATLVVVDAGNSTAFPVGTKFRANRTTTAEILAGTRRISPLSATVAPVYRVCPDVAAKAAALRTALAELGLTPAMAQAVLLADAFAVELNSEDSTELGLDPTDLADVWHEAEDAQPAWSDVLSHLPDFVEAV